MVETFYEGFYGMGTPQRLFGYGVLRKMNKKLIPSPHKLFSLWSPDTKEKSIVLDFTIEKYFWS